MKIKYFSDTDTALVEFSDHKVAEPKEINENIYIDLDTSGNLVAMTIEHARKQANLPHLSYEQMEKELPNKSPNSMSSGCLRAAADFSR
jgi:uncharacterized protein YuzE